MNNRISSASPTSHSASSAPVSGSTPRSNPYIPSKPKVLSPGEWVRAVSGVDAPFGFDRMPTVFG